MSCRNTIALNFLRANIHSVDEPHHLKSSFDYFDVATQLIYVVFGWQLETEFVFVGPIAQFVTFTNFQTVLQEFFKEESFLVQTIGL